MNANEREAEMARLYDVSRQTVHEEMVSTAYKSCVPTEFMVKQVAGTQRVRELVLGYLD